jgi:hypothetical protein
MSLRTRTLATTLALVAIGLGYGLSQRQAHPGPPRPVARAAPVPPLPAPPPTAAEVLERGDALRLTSDQVARLGHLARMWSAEVAPLETAIQDARAEFEAFAASAKSGSGVSLAEIQRRGADLQALSVELRERRLTHSRRTMEILTDAQRATLQTASLQSPGGRA